MDKKIEPKILQGFRDLSPNEANTRLSLIRQIEKTSQLFGYLPLETPALEYAEVILGKYGQEGEKLIYKFKDLGEREIALRYDLTVSLARYIAQNSRNITKPFKRYQYGLVWRAEKPQKGRFREFGQFDFDIIGTDSYQAEAEIINLDYQILSDLGADNFQILINSRKFLSSILDKFSVDQNLIPRIFQIIDKIDKIGKETVINELRNLNISEDSVLEIEKFIGLTGSNDDILNQVENLIDAKEEIDNFRQILATIQDYGLDMSKIKIDFSLARGLDYYTGFIIETKIIGAEEFGSVASGGRYDDLVKMFSDEKLGSVGFSIGIDRLIEALGSINKLPKTKETKALMVFDQKTQNKALEIVKGLRQKDVAIEIYLNNADLGKKLKYANNKKIPYVIILETPELETNTVKIKNMTNGEQKNIELNIEKIIQEIIS